MTKDSIFPNFDSLDAVQHWALEELLETGERASPRGLDTLELFPVSFTLTNPRRRRILNPVRKWSFPLALGEFCWHVSGSNKVDFIQYYAPQWKDFTEDGETIRGSCYGHRIFRRASGRTSQWERVINILRSDQHSRRAVLYFSNPIEVFTDSSKDVPCATTLQFAIRSGRLHAITQMRSNDVIWGLPYDVFLFTMLQELLACELDIEVGTYSHSVASLHLYARHFDLAKRIIASPIFPSSEMPRMESQSELPVFLNLEEKLRRGEPDVEIAVPALSGYWKTLFLVLEEYRRRKIERDENKNLRTESDKKYEDLMKQIASVNLKLNRRDQTAN